MPIITHLIKKSLINFNRKVCDVLNLEVIIFLIIIITYAKSANNYCCAKSKPSFLPKGKYGYLILSQGWKWYNRIFVGLAFVLIWVLVLLLHTLLHRRFEGQNIHLQKLSYNQKGGKENMIDSSKFISLLFAFSYILLHKIVRILSVIIKIGFYQY